MIVITIVWVLAARTRRRAKDMKDYERMLSLASPSTVALRPVAKSSSDKDARISFLTCTVPLGWWRLLPVARRRDIPMPMSFLLDAALFEEERHEEML